MDFHWLFILVFILFSQEDPFKEERHEMVKNQLERRGIESTSVLNAMRSVKRHLFVPPQSQKHAYKDSPLPIGYGQTISQPYIVAYMTEIIDPQPDFKVLEIGTGSGYQAAVLGKLVKEVYTIEIVEELGNAAASRLKSTGYDNVKTKVADGYFGWEEHAPFDAIVVTAAAEFIPPPLIKQLKNGGKMIIPVGSPFMTQMLTLVEKKGGKPITKTLFPVRFVPFTRED
ncbi:protein-L-isoaspartate(D-aspartate) O-methyltransferase [Echinicola jeungdonensis]|uniref:Protein-L-isoaspartate O-methyltransferase n=1 Tax=Echinicola jeungdonensis TaxID=709343 RepID=A0ABV5J797_9BACT|nr:protein-L-isoaspartate(D-aspartate) O-methyltransferase [Echinicola jeungdonensis]MDN3669818.1 protein-L-isoaspartate(D-aspartate) O-methyltransferase [Echinicola jeungdonensis]